jgi:serine/threonine-protein kinase RsbT
VAKGLKSKATAHTSGPAAAPAADGGQICVSIVSPAAILEARRRSRDLAAALGFSPTDCTLVATAVSELARNIVLYAQQGEIRLSPVSTAKSVGIVITALDNGPGIHDLRSAMLDGFSTSRGLGLGLPGVKRIMDEFDILSGPKTGTVVTAKKWRTR